MHQRISVPVLMYHEVADQTEVDELAKRTQRGYILLREDFERQVELIKRAGYSTISLRQLIAWVDSGIPLPEKPVIMSFDDGFLGNYRYALPTLREHGLVASFFVVSNKIGDSCMMTWEQLREMKACGMEIESHTANHPLLSTIGLARTIEEFESSKAKIEDGVGEEVRFMSLPNGDSNPYYRQVAVEYGYAAVCGSRFGYNKRGLDRYDLRRIAIKQSLDIDSFRALLDQDPRFVLYNSALAAGKAAVTRTIGKRTYDRLYNLVFGVQEQDKSKQL